MATCCLIPKCNWIDHVDNLFDHMEKYHRDHIIKVNSTNMIEFSINDFMIRPRNQKPILLSTEIGLYWFLRRIKSSDEMLLGIYYAGDSENINYTIRFGRKHDGFVMYYGGFEMKSDTTVNECRNDIYPISYCKLDIENMLQHNVTTVNIVLHTENGWIDNEEFPPDQHVIEWSDVSEELKNKNIDTLFCIICYENLRNKQIISCELRHNMCEPCMQLYMDKQKTDICPCCRDVVRYNSRNCTLEKIACVFKWPADPVDDENQNVTILENDINGNDDSMLENVAIISISDNDSENVTFEMNDSYF